MEICDRRHADDGKTQTQKIRRAGRLPDAP